jgi:hypothetical protein
VASRFEPGERNVRLSWSHHAELAALDPCDRGGWLERADSERMSVRDLRHELRRAERGAQARRRPAPVGERSAAPVAAVVCPRCGSNISLTEASERDGRVPSPRRAA